MVCVNFPAILKCSSCVECFGILARKSGKFSWFVPEVFRAEAKEEKKARVAKNPAAETGWMIKIRIGHPWLQRPFVNPDDKERRE